MSRNKRISKALSLLIIIIMVLGCFTPFVHAEGNQFSSAKLDLREEALNKIMSEVIEDLEKEDIVEILVYMKEQVDMEMVAQATSKAVSSSMTPYNTKLAVRRGVVEALKDTSEVSQENILYYLEQEKEKGNVIEYESYHIVNMVYVKATKEVVENISFMPEVEKIYKNKTHQIDMIDKHMKIEEENQLDDSGLEWNIERINADKVWKLGYDGTGAVVASIDTGVDWTHPTLKEKWRGYDPITGETNPEGNWFDPVYNEPLPRDPTRMIDNGRGTYTMGIMVGQELDGKNKIGVAPGAQWITARAFDNAGYTTDKILLLAAEWMLAPGGNPEAAPDVVNNSWDGVAGMDDWYRNVVRAWRAARIFPVFSVGQKSSGDPPSSGSITSPASYPESFAVTAVDKDNIRASFSKQGPSPYDETMIKPNIAAPGVRVRSSIPGRGHYTGTYLNASIAAPHISGVVALLVSANNTLAMDRIEEIITSTAVPLTDDIYTEYPNFGYGYGLVDALGAISSVYDGTGFIDGSVLQEGEDLENAVIVHEQEVFEVYIGSNTDIVAEVSDDVSVTKVELLVKQEGKPYWLMVPMERISGDHKEGIYSGTIASDMLVGDGLTYKILAEDYTGEEVVTKDHNIDIKFGVIPGEYEEGFEEDPIGWVFNGSWEWGAPSGSSPEPYEGDSLAGTNISGNYPDEADDWLISPPLDLRDENLDSATLRFYEWYQLENIHDKGYLLITNDYGETWTEGRPYITGDGKEWRETVIILDDYIGSQEPIFIGFRLTSDRSGNRAGWYIDNVRLVGVDDEPPAIPTGLTAEAGLIGVKLNWEAVPDGDVDHYNVYRSPLPNDGYELITESINNNLIDSEIEFGNTYYYKVAAVDLSGNIGEFSEIVSASLAETRVIFSTDFEDDDGGFVSGITKGTKNPWEWGVPTSGPNAACSGEKLWATNLSGDYETYTDAYIESPAILLPEDKDSILAFNHWVDMQEPRKPDYGQVLISNNDGESWVNITPEDDGMYGGYIREWVEEQIPLVGYRGQDIKIRFFFHSNYSANYLGWYIDDVYIIEDANINENLKPLIYEESLMDIELAVDVEYEKAYSLEPVKPSFEIGQTKGNEYETIEDEIIQSIPIVEATGIPIEGAVVTVLETGICVKTDPATGRFNTRSQAGEYTIRAEAYGFYPQEATVNVEEDRNTNHIFMLEPKPKATIIGRVSSKYYGDAVENAVIRVVEDGNIKPVTTDENGNFTIEGVYEGEYTLKVSAVGFEREEVNIIVTGDEIVRVEIFLNKYVGYEDEIVYDDGSAEGGLVLETKDNGLAVRFTPPEYGKVMGANMYFHGEHWPAPGGTEIGVAIYRVDKSGDIIRIGDPKVVDIVRGKWNYIDLSEFQLVTDEDFYISTVQTKTGRNSPGLGIDESSPYGERSFLNMGGRFVPLYTEGITGGIMARAVMEYALGIPRITNLGELTYTNEDNVTIEGLVKADGKINIYVNDEKIISVETENKTFTAEVQLLEVENTIMITAEMNGIETSPSEVIRVIKDKVPPTLVVEKPLDNTKINSEVVHVIGNATDDIRLAQVLINGVEVEVDEDGDVHKRLIVDPGENLITIKAIDEAGNKMIVERKVYVGLDAPVISNIEPAEDLELRVGDTLTVSFEASAGGEGYFRLAVPSNLGSEKLGIPMTEEDGVYTGIWTVHEGLGFEELLVEVIYIDEYGFEITEIAAGKITILDPTDEEPMENLPANTVIVGDEAFDIRYLNSNGDAQQKLINWNNEGNEVYIKLSEERIVNIRGQVVSIDELPDDLTYYDVDGNTTIYVK